MKSKNGFVASSLMFSFFLVFAVLALVVIASYAHYRGLSNELNGNILNDLNENVIPGEWKEVENVITNGNFKDSNNWYFTRTNIVNDASGNYVSMVKQNGEPENHIVQYINNKLKIGTNRKIYFRYLAKRTYKQDCLNEDFHFFLKIGSQNPRDFENRSVICDETSNPKDVSDWNLYSWIFEDVDVNSSSQSIDIFTYNLRHTGPNSEAILIKDVMLIDVTDLWNATSGMNLEAIHTYLDNQLADYFDGSHSIRKIRTI